MFKWLRLPDADAAGTNSNDTTEVQIGTGLTIPDWARSIRYAHTHIIYLAETTAEEVAGYFRLVNDKNTLDPLNFPLPLITQITGALGTHVVEDMVTAYCEHEITPNDVLRAYAALDAATTGVHTIQVYLGLSSQDAKINLKSQKSAVVAGSATANAESTTTTIQTIADRTKEVIGMWNYFVSDITAAQTMGGYVKMKSSVAGWQEQRIPTNTVPSGLSTQITPLTKPVICTLEEWMHKYQGYHVLPWFDRFPTKTRQSFDFSVYMDGTNTNAPNGRYGLMWLE